MRDLGAGLSFKRSIDVGAKTATATGSAVDLADFDGAVAEVIVGTVTDGTHTPKLQDSPDNSTWTDVAAANLIGSFAAIASNTLQKVGYVGINRYLRGVITISGATTGAVEGLYIVAGFGRKLPES